MSGDPDRQDSAASSPHRRRIQYGAGPLEINLTTCSGTVDGKRLVLGPKEYLVLQILAQHAGKVVTRQQIMKQVWGGPHLNDTHYLRIIVRKLRKKIGSIRPGRAFC